MLVENFDRIYNDWNALIQYTERKKIENELMCFSVQCKNACDVFMTYIPNYKGFYRVERIIIFQQFEKVYSFLSILKLVNEQAYNNFTENHDIVNLKEYLDVKGENFHNDITRLASLKDYSSFLSHLILRIYDEKNEEKKKEMLQAMM